MTKAKRKLRKNWWEVQGVSQIGGIVPIVVYTVKCKKCGDVFEAYNSLQNMPDACPSCGKENEYGEI